MKNKKTIPDIEMPIVCIKTEGMHTEYIVFGDDGDGEGVGMIALAGLSSDIPIEIVARIITHDYVHHLLYKEQGIIATLDFDTISTESELEEVRQIMEATRRD